MGFAALPPLLLLDRVGWKKESDSPFKIPSYSIHIVIQTNMLECSCDILVLEVDVFKQLSNSGSFVGQLY